MIQTVKELHQKRMKIWEQSIANHTKYLDKQTGIFLPQYTQERACPVCKIKNELEVFYKEGGRYVKCKTCTMIYLNPVFTDEAIEDYYKNNHIEQSSLVESDTDNFYTKIYTNGLDDIENERTIENILDIGCSSGAFLDIAQARKINTYGVELNKLEFEISQKKKHKTYNKLLKNIYFDTKFDVITMWDVFEHIKDGEQHLRDVKKLLNKDGIIFIQIPSCDSLAAKILQEHCNMYDGLEHVNLYNVQSIKKLASTCGLEILNIKTIISEIGVINNYLNYEDPYLGETLNKTNIFHTINETQIHKNLEGYKMQVLLGVKP